MARWEPPDTSVRRQERQLPQPRAALPALQLGQGFLGCGGQTAHRMEQGGGGGEVRGVMCLKWLSAALLKQGNTQVAGTESEGISLTPPHLPSPPHLPPILSSSSTFSYSSSSTCLSPGVRKCPIVAFNWLPLPFKS